LRVARLGAKRAPVAPSPVLESFIVPDAKDIEQSARDLLLANVKNGTHRTGKEET
jgi:hypothetical protein